MQGGTAIFAPDAAQFCATSGAFRIYHKNHCKGGFVLKQLLSVVLKRQADALVRLTGLCYRRGVAIESLSYVSTPQPNEMRLQAVLACGPAAASQLRRQVAKTIGVIVTEIAPYKEGGV